MSEQMISLGSIDDPEFNSRLSADPAGLKELAESMPTPDHQIQAVTVEENGNRFLLVAGSRRVAAARINGWTEIRANVRPSTNKVRRIMDNFVENNQRRDLTLFEQARAISLAKDEGATGPDIAAGTGWSKQKISNLLGMYTRLPPSIHEHWRDEHKAATFEFLQQLAVIKGKTPEAIKEAQEATWKERAKLFDKLDAKLDDTDDEDESTNDSGKGKGKTKPAADPVGPPYKVPQKRYNDILRAVNKAKLPKVVIEVMRALVGTSNKIKTVWDADAGTQEAQ